VHRLDAARRGLVFIMGRFYAWTAAGTRKHVTVCGATANKQPIA
jgi:hypothetical protein